MYCIEDMFLQLVLIDPFTLHQPCDQFVKFYLFIYFLEPAFRLLSYIKEMTFITVLEVFQS